MFRPSVFQTEQPLRWLSNARVTTTSSAMTNKLLSTGWYQDNTWGILVVPVWPSIGGTGWAIARGWRRPVPSPSRENGHPIKERPRTRRLQEAAHHTWRESQGNRGAEGPVTGESPGADRDLGTGRVRQQGGERNQERKQAQACGAGRRDEWWNLAGVGCGKIPGGLWSALVAVVGSWYDREVQLRQTGAD